MLRILDNFYFRCVGAWKMLTVKDFFIEAIENAHDEGISIGNARVMQQLEKHDPYQFQNGHFKMGYYYAVDQVKKVMTNDNEDNPVA